MPSLFRTWVLVGALLDVRSLAGPIVRSRDIEVIPALQERIPYIELGNYNLETTHENDVLFDLSTSVSAGSTGESIGLKVSCVDCRTWGNVVVSTNGAEKNDDIIGDIISFFKNPADTIVEAFNMDIKVSFENVGGHFEFDIIAVDATSYAFPIFQSMTPLGGAISEDVSLGLVLSVDLVFSLSAEVDLEAGFEFSFPQGAYITVDPLTGDIKEDGFIGGDVNHLPVTVTSGSATFKAALRVQLQMGTTVELFGTGFDFELGVFANLIEYVATLSSTDSCEISITEGLDVNIGAFAHNVIEINYKTFGVEPPIVTTVLSVPLPSLCITRPADGPSGTVSSVAAVITVSTSQTPGPVVTSVPTSSSSVGGIFAEGSSSSSPTNAASQSTNLALSASSSTPYSNNTITSAAIPMTTSTVYATSLITITSCASTVSNCPASLASEIIITSTTVLYTTICPVGQVQPSSVLSSVESSPTSASPKLNTTSAVESQSHLTTLSPSIAATTGTISAASSVKHTLALPSPIPLTPCATKIISTIYTPTFEVPTYTMPTATSFTVPYPSWNATSSLASNTFQATITAPSVGGKNTASPSSTSINITPTPATISKVKDVSVTGNGTNAGASPSAPLTVTGSASGSRESRMATYVCIVTLGTSFFVTVLGF